jgi:hypothetical protein
MSFPIHYLQITVSFDAIVLAKSSQISYDRIFYVSCESLVWNLLHVVLLAPRILRCLIDFWENCAPLVWASENIVK